MNIRQTGLDIRQPGSDKTDVLLDRDQEGRLPRPVPPGAPPANIRPCYRAAVERSRHIKDSQDQILVLCLQVRAFSFVKALLRVASERRGNHLNGVEDFHLKAKARFGLALALTVVFVWP